VIFCDKILRILGTCLLLLCFSTSYSQRFHREKIYIHLDKSYYLIGEECWFKAYVVNAVDLLPTTFSGVLYVDLIDPGGAVIKHQKLKIIDGQSNGDFLFNEAAVAGQYIIRAYTNFMRNLGEEFFFSTSFPVYNLAALNVDTASLTTSNEIDLQFFPEGGTAVRGLQSTIAFKALDEWGNGIDIKGKIVDKNNRQVGNIKSIHNGMGLFPYVPSNDKFRIILDNGQSFELPDALETGAVMNINNNDPEKIHVEIRSSNRTLLSNFRLEGLMNNNIVFDKKFQSNSNQSNVEISKKGLPGGILQLSLFDREDIPLAERIIFVDNKSLMQIHVERDTNTTKNDSISFIVQVKDENGNPLETFLSLAVMDADFVSSHFMADNISTYFLFQSDLKGKIDDPGWYFETKSARNMYALDLVMLTHGWRKFDSLLPIIHKREMSLSLKGSVVSKQSRKPIPDVNLTLMLAGIDYNGIFTTTTDQSGSFSIDSVDYSDSTKLVWQIRNAKGKFLNADITLTDSVAIPAVTLDLMTHDKKRTADVISESVKKTVREFSAMKKVETLPEVVVVGGHSQSYAIGPDQSLIRPGTEDYHLFASSFISRYVPDLPFLKNDEYYRWLLPSRKPVWIVIDGNFINDTGPASNPYLLMNAYRTDEIDYILVSGTTRKGYTILIHTKSDSPMQKSGIVTQFASGYQWSKTFYKPKFLQRKLVPERLTTIYWDPYVATDAEGKAVINISCKEARALIVSVQGMSQGITGAALIELKVR
jgi:hypothetical protein